MNVRSAQRTEYPLIRDLFCRDFHADEAELFDHLVAHDPGCVPDNIRVAVDRDDRPVAVTVLLPRQIRTRRGWAPGAVITLVACEPALQRQGYGGATVRDALACMTRMGLAVAILYGHRTYYPRFGFAPVLPRYELFLPAAPGGEPLGTTGEFASLLPLYKSQVANYPCAVARGPEPWLWAIRNPQVHAIFTLPGCLGYAFGGANSEARTLNVHEAAATDAAAARRLVAALQREAQERGLERIRLGLPPDGLVTRTAVLAGAEQHIAPAAGGMACVTRWDPLLPPGYAVDGNCLCYEGRPILQALPDVLTQLVLGYRSAADLDLMENVQILDPTPLQRDFPPAYPRWSLAPFWWG